MVVWGCRHPSWAQSTGWIRMRYRTLSCLTTSAFGRLRYIVLSWDFGESGRERRCSQQDGKRSVLLLFVLLRVPYDGLPFHPDKLCQINPNNWTSIFSSPVVVDVDFKRQSLLNCTIWCGSPVCVRSHCNCVDCIKRFPRWDASPCCHGSL